MDPQHDRSSDPSAEPDAAVDTREPRQLDAGVDTRDPRQLDACLSTRALMSLDPLEVVETATRLIAGAVGAAQVTVAALGEPQITSGAPLDEFALALVRQAQDELTTVSAQSGKVDYTVFPLIVAPGETDAAIIRPAAGAIVLVAPLGALTAADIEVVRLVADRAALALGHAALYQTQAAIAQRVQRLLVPLEPPRVDGLQIGTFFRSRTRGAEIGGDFYDFTSFSPGQVAVAIGDVSGKGVEAGSVTIMTKYALRALVRTSRWPSWPGDILRDLHNSLQDQLEPSRFVTVAFALIDAVHGSMTIASAGHPAPVVIRDAHAERPLLVTSPAIAVTDASELDAYPTERVSLAPGDTVVFYTDGIAELRDADGEFYDDVRLDEALGELGGLASQELAERLAADAAAFSARPPKDDIAIVAVRLTQT
jgi:serine phosphatase RsbU (regulator of sigma subunit)